MCKLQPLAFITSASLPIDNVPPNTYLHLDLCPEIFQCPFQPAVENVQQTTVFGTILLPRYPQLIPLKEYFLWCITIYAYFNFTTSDLGYGPGQFLAVSCSLT